ncbi:hypothetical protein JTE90_028610 [Oedothorax gibbosus]|uniref:Uncharacterized protein n=1 Tax=Oedothorax gibbosus TaxID=931172 RepID=A0AAV6TPA7_9ARAC|nr:hypothetical protein JTE90_007565 [Oedothorax gibbosus]KAG8176628.1 hypothetical protein JTE90_028610 [Oedothorax gibbosus]
MQKIKPVPRFHMDSEEEDESEFAINWYLQQTRGAPAVVRTPSPAVGVQNDSLSDSQSTEIYDVETITTSTPKINIETPTSAPHPEARYNLRNRAIPANLPTVRNSEQPILVKWLDTLTEALRE